MKMQKPIIIYEVENGQTHIEVQLDKDTLWLNLLQIAELFERDKSAISRHLKNIFDSGELDKNATVQIEGNRSITRDIEYFNLDAIISVGYRVNSKKGTQFRIWANNT
ncbi:MAG: RhuM family protein [Methylobacter sp.]|nr:RhuM family protein [Methylobacter sp.]